MIGPDIYVPIAVAGLLGCSVVIAAAITRIRRPVVVVVEVAPEVPFNPSAVIEAMITEASVERVEEYDPEAGDVVPLAPPAVRA